jgi:methylthioribose-1-phosphate isomerase
MAISTIKWIRGSVRIIDQTRLPQELRYVYCSNVGALWKAIKVMKIRGAPALGVAAAFGVVLGIQRSRAKNFRVFARELEKIINYLGSSRPTAVNLFSALERMRKTARESRNYPIEKIKQILLKEAMKIYEEDRRMCRKLADYGSRLVKKNDRILTICNAGALATSDFGTALGVICRAKEQKKNIKVYACETRPLLQGARLTTWELKKQKIDTTLICDSMAASLMRDKMIDKVFVGADRIANNGDTANKVGTYNLAVLAKYHRVAFYVVAPSSSFDLGISGGGQIPIEQRDESEILEFAGLRIAAEGVKVYNPAFDVTPHNLISAIITESGIIRPPYRENIKKVLRK